MDNKQQDEQQSCMSRSQYRQQQRQTEQPMKRQKIQLIDLIVAKQLLVSVMTKQWQKKQRA